MLISLDYAGDDVNEFIEKLKKEFNVKNVNIELMSNGWPNLTFTVHVNDEMYNSFSDFMNKNYGEGWEDYVISY